MNSEGELIAKAMAEAPRTICVDLDGTLASEKEGWKGFKFIGKPIARTIRALRREKKAGAKIILHTCRITSLDNKVSELSLATIRAWVKKHDVPIDEIWMSTGKPWANEYWDDKAVNTNSEEFARRK